ncbi:lamin tail domain-containing protein (plasmid) [Haloferax mediterranei ATCC 33500]|uniref:Lamin tail domain-containing protein n=2 Tax=Haloferacaceae TaxID=1644056 RepID=I3RBA2_HALMT|nr:hypothetical protein HFX_6392 [Haloferax mediterranei ATCC 33500]AHZ24433.1 hypothetical protein BM92_16075 [Haloferax mediterranei ATCC 33500]ELZ97174.1 hypothetical protein C439_17668 [Haloferax mediterranei ATCC 33500]QCQ77085.1 lamin tail domain-containing protein [Haloferax mediterranei ATCC 33500]
MSGSKKTEKPELQSTGVYPDEIEREFISYEYILMENESEHSLDVSGYVIESDQTYRIEELVLEPGARLVLLSRSGDDTTLQSRPPASLRYAGFGFEEDTSVLAENGTIRIRKAQGTLVAAASYESPGCDGGTVSTESGTEIGCLH